MYLYNLNTTRERAREREGGGSAYNYKIWQSHEHNIDSVSQNENIHEILLLLIHVSI